MREVVIVPTFDRPEFLWTTLESIRESEPTIPIHVFVDRAGDAHEVTEHFGAAHHSAPQHSYHGNSYNMLEALKWSYGAMYERVFIIEDDAIVDHSFFSWCRAALDNHPDEFGACGWRFSPDQKVSDGPDMLLPWYLSVAACLLRQSIFHIIQHARPEYYSDMGGYLDRTIPSPRWKGSLHYEQDGLTVRVASALTKRCVWPRRPRAIHIGWSGYHMAEGKRLQGSLAERVEALRLIIHNPTVLANLMNGGAPPGMGRCERCKRLLLDESKNARLVCVGCYHADHPGRPVCSVSHYYLTTTPSSPASSPAASR